MLNALHTRSIFEQGEVYLILHSFNGTKLVYKGFGIFKEYSQASNGANVFTGQIAGNGRARYFRG